MDIIITLVLMAALYIIPELLKNKKPKEYKYPEIPEIPDQTDMPQKPSIPKTQSESLTLKKHSPYQYSKDIKIPDSTYSTYCALPPKVSNSEASAPMSACLERQPEQRVQMDQAAILNGIIWAEVLLPPRAHRPLGIMRHPN